MLVNNAGIMACAYAKTEDGLERQFATSHMGPSLSTNLTVKKVLASSASRIVNVSSDGQRPSDIRWGDIGFTVSPDLWTRRYQQPGRMSR